MSRKRKLHTDTDAHSTNSASCVPKKKRKLNQLPLDNSDESAVGLKRKFNKSLQNIIDSKQQLIKRIHSLEQERDRYKKERDHYKSVCLQMLSITNREIQTDTINLPNKPKNTMEIDSNEAKLTKVSPKKHKKKVKNHNKSDMTHTAIVHEQLNKPHSDPTPLTPVSFIKVITPQTVTEPTTNSMRTTDILSLQAQTELINQAFEIPNMDDKRNFFDKLLKTHPYLDDEIYFRIGNSIHEVLEEYREAMDWYQQSLSANRERRGYISTVTVHRMYQCKTLMNETIDNDLIQSLKVCWQNADSQEPKHKSMRQKWRRYGGMIEQMFGAAQCAEDLSKYYEDECEKNNLSKFNEKSLVWNKRALNILEKTGDSNKMIILSMVGMDEVIDSYRNDKAELIKDKMKVQRKRINIDFEPKIYIETAESVLQSYFQCLLERFFGKNYTRNLEGNENMSDLECFADFRVNKEINKYHGDFEKYLRMELDLAFEMNHSHFAFPDRYTNIEIGDCYQNYAAFLFEKLEQYKAAERWYQKSLDYNDKDRIAYWNMAELFERTHRWQEAIDSYDKYLKHTPKTPREAYTEAMKDVRKAKEMIEEQMLQWSNDEDSSDMNDMTENMEQKSEELKAKSVTPLRRKPAKKPRLSVSTRSRRKQKKKKTR